MLSRCKPMVVLALLGLLFFAPLAVQPDGILYSDYSDFITCHLPPKHFLVRSWQQTGEVPLWCPQVFSGMPFVHDIQVAAFYPLHFPLYLLPEQHIGAACSWLIALHVILAGLCMYAYARHQGLHGAGALVAALGFMFFGKWLLHVLAGGHYILVPLAWLPLVLLWTEQAIERRSLLHATGAALAFALIVLGTHPQLTLYAGLFVAMWSLPNVLARRSEAGDSGPPASQDGDRPAPLDRNLVLPIVRRWLLVGVWLVVIAGLVCSIQLLPSIEATRESSRTLGVPFDLSSSLTGSTRSLIGLIGPSLLDDASWLWEDRAGLSLVWLTLALCAPVLAPQRSVRWQAALTVFWFVLGLGGILLLRWLPGFQMWRLPSRMFVLLGLPVALLAGRTVQTLVGDAGLASARRERCRGILLRAGLYTLIPLAAYAALQWWQRGARLLFSPYWPSLLVTMPLAWWLLGSPTRSQTSAGSWTTARRLDWLRSPSFACALVWIGLLVVDLWALAMPLVQVRSEEEVFAPSACVSYLAGKAGEHGRILDIPARPRSATAQLDATSVSKTPLWPNFAMVAGVEPVRGYNSFDVRRYKEYLEMVIDRDQPLEALSQFTEPGPGGFALTNAALGDLLGVRYLLLEADVPLEQYVPDGALGHWRRVFDDLAPHAYNFVPADDSNPDCGLVPLPPFAVYENSQVLPRAFVVADARPLPERAQVLETLRKTDLRRRVLIEGFAGPLPEATASSGASTAIIRDYQPNRVTLDVDAAAPGWLVLTDIWYPGWTCTLDDEPVPVYRADFLFRAVQVPAGAHRLEFRFTPQSYQIGKMLTLGTLALLALGCAGWLMKRGVSARASKTTATRNNAADCRTLAGEEMTC